MFLVVGTLTVIEENRFLSGRFNTNHSGISIYHRK